MEFKLFAFPARLVADQEDGGFVVTFPDLPEAITQGETKAQCLSEASDCLAEAIAARIDEEMVIPLPSSRTNQQYLIPVPIEIAWKAEVYSAMWQYRITTSRLASWLDVDKEKIRRLINPRYTIDQKFAERALQTILKQLEIAGSKSWIN